jgi:hypothetical protein
MTGPPRGTCWEDYDGEFGTTASPSAPCGLDPQSAYLGSDKACPRALRRWAGGLNDSQVAAAGGRQFYVNAIDSVHAASSPSVSTKRRRMHRLPTACDGW